MRTGILGFCLGAALCCLAPASPIVSAAAPQPALPCNGAGCAAWAATYNGPGGGEDTGTAIALSRDGRRLYVTGPSAGASSFDYATIAYDAITGAQLWVARYDGPAGGDDESTSIAVSPDGTRVFVTGMSVGTGGAHDWATVAYDSASGAQLWVERLTNSFHQDNVAEVVSPSPDGTRVYVTGWITAGVNPQNGLAKYDIAVVAYAAATGTSLWEQDYAGQPTASGTDWDIAYALTVMQAPGADDRVVVAGRSDVSSGATDLIVLAFDGVTGTQQWQYLYSGPAQNRDIAYAVTGSRDGSAVYATGYDTTADGHFDYVTVALDAATGAQRWTQLYDGDNASVPSSTTGITDNSLAFGVAVSPDGSSVAITGTSGDFPGAYERSMTTLLYDANTGAQRWLVRQPEPPDGGTGTALAFSPDGAAVYVVGAEGNNVFGVGGGSAGVQYDVSMALAASYASSNGAQNWLVSYGVTRQSGANALAVSPDGSNVYLTGGAHDSQSDVVTLDLSTAAAPATGVPDAPVLPWIPLTGVAAALGWNLVRRRRQP